MSPWIKIMIRWCCFRMFHVVSIIHVENPVWETRKPLSLKMGASFQSFKTSGRWWGNHLNRWSAGRCWELMPGNERLENRGLFESLETTDFYTAKKLLFVLQRILVKWRELADYPHQHVFFLDIPTMIVPLGWDSMLGWKTRIHHCKWRIPW